jgi:NADH/F420H2 dehydrogenase subunit C
MTGPMEIKTALEARFQGIRLKPVRETLLLEDPQDLTRVASFLKDDLGFNYLSSITAADYLQYLETVYHFYSMEKKTGPLVLRLRVPRDAARMPSLVPVFRGAEYQEREAYDLFGIFFDGHPDMRRIFMWDGFEGWPLRKDYQQEDSETLEAGDVEWLEKHGVKVPEAMAKKAEEMKAQGKRAVAEKPKAGAEPA